MSISGRWKEETSSNYQPAKFGDFASKQQECHACVRFYETLFLFCSAEIPQFFVCAFLAVSYSEAEKRSPPSYDINRVKL